MSSETIAPKRRRRSGVFDRWHTRKALPDDEKCTGKDCRNVRFEQAARHGVGKRWTARYVDDRGREVSQGFDTKREADDHLRVQMASLVRGDYVAPDRAAMLFGDLAASWLASLSQNASTRRSYESILDTHVLPRWKSVKLADIEHGDIATWIAGLRVEDTRRKDYGEPLAPSSARHVHVVMRMILDLAVRDGRMPRNLSDGVKLPKKRRATQRFLSRPELARLVAASDHLAAERERRSRKSWKNRATRRKAENAHIQFEPVEIEQDSDGRNVIPPAAVSVDGVMIRTLALTGIRWGELAGLRVDCVDLGKRRLSIRSSASEVGGKIVWSDTKNHTARSVVFPTSLVAPLRAQVEGKPADALVFPSRTSEPIRNTNWVKWAFKPAVELAQLAPLTPHDLRDTYASLAIRARANVKDVQRQLGHASAAMTLDVYSGLFEDGLDAIADALDGE